jgi:membrane protease subunit (stomatin/prohibitin family)
MKNAAKWIAIGWSLFCLAGIVIGLASVGEELNKPMNEYESAGANIGVGCGMAMWVGIWAAIAGPAFLVYVVAGQGSTITAAESTREARLCKECGKYSAAGASFCPHCGARTH